MKSKFKFVLSLLLLMPLMLLAACDITNYYTITCRSSDETLGLASGGSDVAKADGCELTLVATELNPEQTPFVCWIKDNSKVVSFDKNYSLTYSAQTQGNYTAFYHENPNGVAYATVTDIKIEGVSSGTVQVQYASTNSSTNYRTLENLSFSSGTCQTDKTNLIFFGGASGSDGRNEFVFRVIVSQPTSTGGETSYTIMIDSILTNAASASQNQANFDSQGQCTLTGTNNDNITLTITLSKISATMYA